MLYQFLTVISNKTSYNIKVVVNWSHFINSQQIATVYEATCSTCKIRIRSWLIYCQFCFMYLHTLKTYKAAIYSNKLFSQWMYLNQLQPGYSYVICFPLLLCAVWKASLLATSKQKNTLLNLHCPICAAVIMQGVYLL